ncbi:MAG: hypothetical protein ABEJ44_04235 [Halanaeroarchaeum sp.]
MTLAGLAGCTTTALQAGGESADRTLYVGAYHWGFILLDEDGVERDQVTLDVGSTVEIVGFGLEADDAISTLPTAIQESLPDHETMEARNLDRIPAPSEAYLHEALEEAEERYPEHSLAIVPAGYGRNDGRMMDGGNDGGMMGGGMMDGGMMGTRGMVLPQNASSPAVTRMVADRRGTFSLDCGAYCGYGHRYMNSPGAIVVQ